MTTTTLAPPVITDATRRDFLALVGAAGLLAACGTDDAPAAPTSATRTVATVFGPIDVPAQPQRIVAVSYNTPFQLLAVGVEVVGAFDYTALLEQLTPEQVALLQRTTVIGTFGEPDPEAVAALAPDLVVGEQGEVDEALWRTLSAVAPTVVVGGADRGDWKAVSSGIAEAAGAGAALAARTAGYDAEVARLRDEHADTLGGRTWAAFSFGDSDGQFSLQYPSGAVGAVLAELGVTFLPVVEQTPAPDAGYVSYSLERLDLLEPATVAVHPQLADGSQYPQITAITGSELYRRLPVVAAGHVHGVVDLYGVIDHTSALAALRELERTVLIPLA